MNGMGNVDTANWDRLVFQACRNWRECRDNRMLAGRVIRDG